MSRRFGYAPEIVSLVTGLVAWVNVMAVERAYGMERDFWLLTMAYSLGAALISAVVYRIGHRPIMRRHFAIYFLALAIVAFDFFLYLFLYGVLMLFFFAVLTIVPALLVAVPYEKLYMERFIHNMPSQEIELK